MTQAVTHTGARARSITGALAAAACLAFLLSLVTGPTGFGLGAPGGQRWLVLTEIRLPRALLGALVGGALGLSGAALQGYLRNPLAEPGLLGVSSGAAFGAVASIHLGLAGAFSLALPLAGLAGAALATLAVFLLAGDRAGPATLILAGVAISALGAALMSLALNLSRNPFAAAESIFWMMGSLADRSLVQVWLAGPLILTGMALLMRLGRALDGLSLGDDVARTLGIQLERTRFLLIAGTALCVGAATAVTGIIGFVGLVVPHVLRPIVGPLPSRLLLASLFGGAAMLLIADVAVQLIAPLVDVRIGVLTALIGAPFFVWLVLRLRRELTP
jgi:iron complex transport system permease protein